MPSLARTILPSLPLFWAAVSPVTAQVGVLPQGPTRCLLLALTPLACALAPPVPQDLPKGPFPERCCSLLAHGLARATAAPDTAPRLTGYLRNEVGEPLADVFLEARGLSTEPFPSSLIRCLLAATDADGGPRDSGSWTTTDDDGRFSLTPANDPLGFHIELPSGDLLADPMLLTAEPVFPSTSTRDFTVTNEAVETQRPRWANARSLRAAESPESVPTSPVEITLRDPSGRPYPYESSVHVIDAKTRFCVSPDPSVLHSPWLRIHLPPGTYEAHGSAEERTPSCIAGWSPCLAPFGCEPVTFTVEPGVELAVDLTLFQGGRLRLALPTVSPPTDPLLRKALAADPVDPAACHAALLRGAAAQAELVGLDEEATPLRFYAPGFQVSTHFDRILPGTECLTHTILHPGQYTLRVRAPGYQPADLPIEIRAGGIECMTVRLRSDS